MWTHFSVLRHLTEAIATAGTVSYQPMEVLHDGRVTRASDVYSFGMIMLEMFTGVPAFEGYSSSQVSPCLLTLCCALASPLLSQAAAHRALQQPCWPAHAAALARCFYIASTSCTSFSAAASLEGLLASLK